MYVYVYVCFNRSLYPSFPNMAYFPNVVWLFFGILTSDWMSVMTSVIQENFVLLFTNQVSETY